MHGINPQPALEPMRLTFADGPAAGHVIDMERRPTGAPHRLHVVVEPGGARVAENGRETGAVLYRRDLATDAGADYRVAHHLLTPHQDREIRYGGADDDARVEVQLVGGPCAGLTARVDYRDLTPELRIVRHDGRAVVIAVGMDAAELNQVGPRRGAEQLPPPAAAGAAVYHRTGPPGSHTYAIGPAPRARGFSASG